MCEDRAFSATRLIAISGFGHPLRTEANDNATEAQKFGESRFSSNPVRAGLMPGCCSYLGFALNVARNIASEQRESALEIAKTRQISLNS